MIILPWIAGIFAGLAGGVGAAWSLGPVGRSRRRLSRALRSAAEPGDQLERELTARRDLLERAADRYTDGVRQAELGAMDLESLRDHGAAGARLDALRDAGYEHLGQLTNQTRIDLERVHGVGSETAARVVTAVEQVQRRVEQRAVPLPGVNLETGDEEHLVAALLDVLDGRDLGEGPAREARVELEPFQERGAQMLRRSGLVPWFTGGYRRAEREAAESDLGALSEEVEGLRGVRNGPLGALDSLGERQRSRRTEECRQQFQGRYAECCALLEAVLGQAGGRSSVQVRDGRGGLAEAVVERVEAQPLDTTGLRATLRPYQDFGARYLLAQERSVLGDEMGLGKTLQALAAMVHLAQGRDGVRFFVMAPAGLLLNWEREVRRFTDLEPRVLHGPLLAESLAAWLSSGGVAITSYTTLRSAELGRLFQERGEGIELCVADEAHYLKNPEAGRTQAARRLLSQAANVALLSGTPMENHPREFLEVVRGIRAGAAEELERLGIGDVRDGSSAASFQEAVSKVYLRRNQEDVLGELPERLEREEWIELFPGDLAAYQAEVRNKNLMGMRQAATLGDGVSVSAKLQRLEELFEEYRSEGRKVLVFSYFLDVLQAVATRFGGVGILSGRVPPADRLELCDRFAAEDGFSVLPCQIIAAGVGLNLQAASVVVLCEPQFKPSTEEQAIARAHRMGQTRRVMVHRLLARETCDESLLEVLGHKAKLFDAYARGSLVADLSSESRDTAEAGPGETATEGGLHRRLLERELARLEEG